jgi:hypothetical protein
MQTLFILPILPLIPVWLWWIIASGSLWPIIRLLIELIPSKASSIAIFGSKGAGKTVLWRQLQNEFTNSGLIRTTVEKDVINRFTIEHNGKKQTIRKSLDFPGDDLVVKDYASIIEEGTFIFYLVDLNTLEEKRQETRSRLQAIFKIIKDKKLKNVGLRLVGTHYQRIKDANPEITEEDAKKLLIETLGLRKRRIANNEKEIPVIVAELTDRKDIMQFYDLIVK